MLLLEAFLALNPDWRWWANTLAVFGGIGVLAAAWAGANFLRGHDLFGLPRRLGFTELVVFLLVPPALSLIFAGDWVRAGLTVVANVGALAVVYFAISYAFVPMLRWGAWRLARDLGDVVRLFARALPLLLIFVTFLFINAEVWRVAGTLDAGLLGATVGLFALVAAVFVIFRLPAEIGELATFVSRERVAALVEGTPAQARGGDLDTIRMDAPLSWRQWTNVGLVVLFAQALQVLFVSLVVGAFFVAFGLLAIDVSVIAEWTGGEPNELLEIEVGPGVVLTAELLRVVLFLGAFSGFYFAVSAVTNREYRDQFFEDVVGEVRQAFAVRAVYLGGMGAEAGEGDGDPVQALPAERG